MQPLQSISCGWIVAAVVVSIYQAYRGFMLQWHLNKKLFEKEIANRVVLLCVADAFTYFVCAASGSYAGFLLYWLSEKPEPINVPLAVFLSLYGLLGITAKLPDLLSRLDLLKIGG
jgi:hypothetical protein